MEAPSLDRRLVAILAADVEGYSRLMAHDEETTLATLSSHRATVDDLILKFRGRIANTAGDSVLAEFASVVDTVRCAVSMQQAVAALNAGLPEERRMWFQLGELQAKAHDAGAEQKAKIDTAVTALKVQQTAYQEQMQKVRDASEAAFADLRKGSERMAEEFGKAYVQAAGRFAA